MSGPSHVENLDSMRHDSQNSGDKKIIKNIRLSGGLTARERILSILDDDTFVEIDALVSHRTSDNNLNLHRPLGDGLVAGHGMLDGRRVVCFSQDKSIFAGTIGEMHGKKIVKILEFAEKSMLPIIAIWDGEGERAEEGIDSLGPVGEILNLLTACSGRIPIISVVLGDVKGISTLAVGLSDFTVMDSSNGNLLLSGNSISNSESKDMAKTEFQNTRSGIVSLFAEDENIAFEMVSSLLSFLPDNMLSSPEVRLNGDLWNRKCNFLDEITSNSEAPYDIRTIIYEIMDKETFLEIMSNFANNVIVGFARLDGNAVGIIANQPSVLAGFIDTDSSMKAARFIQTCDCFNIPVITIVDSPGFLPNAAQERNGLIKHAAQLLFAYSEATIPKLSLIIGKAYGGAYMAMGGKFAGSDYNVSWPSGNFLLDYDKDTTNKDNQKHIQTINSGNGIANSLIAAKYGLVDDIISPTKSREYLVKSLRPLLSKRELTIPKKHSNIPL